MLYKVSINSLFQCTVHCLKRTLRVPYNREIYKCTTQAIACLLDDWNKETGCLLTSQAIMADSIKHGRSKHWYQAPWDTRRKRSDSTAHNPGWWRQTYAGLRYFRPHTAHQSKIEGYMSQKWQRFSGKHIINDDAADADDDNDYDRSADSGSDITWNNLLNK